MKIFSAIPIFVAVVESGSFSLAGEKIGISKSAISKRINQLEQDLGVRLLQRTTRRLSLTEAGQRYYDHVQQALKIANEGEDAISHAQTKAQGTIKINAAMAFGRLHLAPLITEFLQAYPDININMVMDDKVVDMVEGGFDLAIRIGDLPDSSLVARKLVDCHSILCAAPSYLQRQPLPQTLSDLTHHNCLYYSYFQAGVEWRFQGPNGEERFLPQGNYQVNNSEALYTTILDGLGICQMPTFIVSGAIADGRLQVVLPDYKLPKHGIYAVFSQRKYQPEKVKVFINFLYEKLQMLQSEWDRGLASNSL